MNPISLSPALLLAGVPWAAPLDEVDLCEVAAVIEADSLTVGGEYSVLIDVFWPEGVAANEVGMPAPIVQFDVPDSVKLGGRYLTTYRELAGNEFLQEPYEHLLEENPARFPFELVSEPKPGETLGINFLAYVQDADGEDHFVRRRYELPLEGGAFAELGDPSVTTWGDDAAQLNVGDEALPFVLPRADGSTLALEDVLGKKNIIITTYRAYW